MLISVVTAVRNRADTIGAAVASVQGQGHGQVEHVVQDGASTDGTLAAVRAAADARTRLVSEPDSGIYDAINRGIARAQGEVIGLMHSDDLFADAGVLEAVAAAFADPGVDAVYGDLDYVAAADTTRVIRRWRSGAFTPARLAQGWMPPHPTLYLRRRVVAAFGAYDTSYRIAADYDAVLRWFGQPGFRAVYIPKVFVKMRNASLSRILTKSREDYRALRRSGMGGASNASLSRILTKSREDYRALRRSGVGGAGTLARKNFGKLHQFITRDTMGSGRRYRPHDQARIHHGDHRAGRIIPGGVSAGQGTRAHHRDHRAGRILPRGAAAGEGLRGARHQAPGVAVQHPADRPYLRGSARPRPADEAALRRPDRHLQPHPHPVRGAPRRGLQPRRAEPRRGVFEAPEYTADVDGMGTLRLLEAIRFLGLETTRFYQASTSELYGLVQEVPQPRRRRSTRARPTRWPSSIPTGSR